MVLGFIIHPIQDTAASVMSKRLPITVCVTVKDTVTYTTVDENYHVNELCNGSCRSQAHALQQTPRYVASENHCCSLSRSRWTRHITTQIWRNSDFLHRQCMYHFFCWCEFINAVHTLWNIQSGRGPSCIHSTGRKVLWCGGSRKKAHLTPRGNGSLDERSGGERS